VFDLRIQASNQALNGDPFGTLRFRYSQYKTRFYPLAHPFIELKMSWRFWHGRKGLKDAETD
jgi:hypothetical protein